MLIMDTRPFCPPLFCWSKLNCNSRWRLRGPTNLPSDLASSQLSELTIIQ
ncbi:uncharacterized protein DS421_1g00650 [Arachis hypogaea]|nr:uncharacterized protein DS421_1g00650 [Arachis hypogaea]